MIKGLEIIVFFILGFIVGIIVAIQLGTVPCKEEHKLLSNYTAVKLIPIVYKDNPSMDECPSGYLVTYSGPDAMITDVISIGSDDSVPYVNKYKIELDVPCFEGNSGK